MKTITGYCVKLPCSGVDPESFSHLRLFAIERCIAIAGKRWKELEKSGFKCVKVKLTIEEI